MKKSKKNDGLVFVAIYLYIYIERDIGIYIYFRENCLLQVSSPVVCEPLSPFSLFLSRLFFTCLQWKSAREKRKINVKMLQNFNDSVPTLNNLSYSWFALTWSRFLFFFLLRGLWFCWRWASS